MTTHMMGLPVPSYYLLRAIVKGVRCYLHDGHVVMDCDLEPNDAVVDSLRSAGYLEQRNEDYIATAKGRGLVQAMHFVPPRLRY